MILGKYTHKYLSNNFEVSHEKLINWTVHNSLVNFIDELFYEFYQNPPK
jgi:hypothetical protein